MKKFSLFVDSHGGRGMCKIYKYPPIFRCISLILVINIRLVNKLEFNNAWGDQPFR